MHDRSKLSGLGIDSHLDQRKPDQPYQRLVAWLQITVTKEKIK
jgi:hypothetical protein